MNSSNSEKNVPTVSNTASEKAVISGIMRHGIDAYVDVQSLINEETFTVDHNKVIYKCLEKLLTTSTKVDLTSILSSAKQLDLYEYIERAEVLKHIKHLMHYNVELENVRNHATKIRKLQFSREIQEELRTIYLELGQVDGDENISEILAVPENKIQNIALKYIREDRSTPQLIGKNLSEYVENLKKNEVKDPGISTGYPTFDKAIGGGLRRQCVDLIGARAKAGKSTIADNIALSVANREIPVLVLDTEMNTEDHWNRLLANISDIPINDISSSRFTDTEDKIEKVDDAAQKLKATPFHYINISGRPFEETLSITRRWLLKEVGYDENGRMKDCLIIYDYLKLMSSESINNNVAEFQALGFQITQLHNFCVEFDVPCLSFVQLNRDGITKETEDAVSGSDRLIWLCTSFSIFKHKTEEEIAADGGATVGGNRKLIPVVSRHGPGLENGYICMNMLGEVSKIEELGTIREVQRRRLERDEGYSDAESEDNNQQEGGS